MDLATQGSSLDQDDVFQLSRENLLVIVFAKTNSPYFSLAVNIAKGASSYFETKIDKTSIHTCAFGRTPEQAARAISLLRYIESWTTKQLFVAGRLVTSGTSIAIATLECYQAASHCNNHEAHCLLLVDEPFIQPRQHGSVAMMTIRIAMPGDDFPSGNQSPAKPKRYVMPCRLGLAYEKIENDHPASWQDQIQAIALHKEVDWCPLFDLSKFRQYE